MTRPRLLYVDSHFTRLGLMAPLASRGTIVHPSRQLGSYLLYAFEAADEVLLGVLCACSSTRSFQERLTRKATASLAAD